MSISLVTDGMLCPIIRRKTISAPDGGEGLVGIAPTAPCGPDGTPSDQPPIAPIQAQAVGPAVPTTPCGTTGIDPTISPPKVPIGQEASETPGGEAPAIPKCPEGTET